MDKVIKILCFSLLGSLLINVAVSQEYATRIIDSIAVNFLSVLVGLAIALHGIVSPFAISCIKGVSGNAESDKRKNLLNEIMTEIKDNALFTLFSYFAVLLTIFIKGIDFPSNNSIILDRFAVNFGMNVSALMYMILAGNALYDTTISIMKLQNT